MSTGAPRSITVEGTNRGAFAPLDWALFCTNGLIWGSSFLLIAIGLDAFPPSIVAFGRLLFGCVTLWLIPGSWKRVERADWPRIVFLGVVWMAVPLSLFPLAEERISSSLAGMINAATPLAAATVAASLLRRLPGRNQVAGLGVGFIGVALISAPSLGEGGSSAVGVLFGLLAVCCYGLSVNVAMPLQQHYGGLPVMARTAAVGMLCTAPIALLHTDEVEFAWGPLAAIVVLGAAGTGIAFWFIGLLAGRVGAARASSLTYLTPAVALALGVTFRNEAVVGLSIAGCALVLVGAFLAGRPDR